MYTKNYHHIILLLSWLILENEINSNLAAEDKKLYEALSLIVQEEFLPTAKPLIFFANFDKKSKSSYYLANDLINGVLQNISNATYKVLYNSKKVFLNVKNNELILLDKVKTFRHFFKKLALTGNMDFSRSILFISSLTTLDYNAMYLIFKDLYNLEMTTVALVVRLANGDIVMLSYFPFSDKSCRDFKPVIINTYLADEHRWANESYFPFKMTNLHGCPVYCCTWKHQPYFSTEPNPKNPNITDYVGLDASALKHLATALNFSIKIRWIDAVRKDNYDGQTLKSKECDLALGGFNYRKELESTAGYSQTRYFLFSHIYIVTNIINIHTTYQKLAFPFDYTVWFALGLTFAFSSLLICTCGRRRQWSGYRNFLIGSVNSTPHFHLYALAVGATMTLTQMPKRNFARFLLICWLLLTFVLRIAYQSGMYQMLRDNSQWNPPQTIANVLEQNYLISMTPENHKYLEVLPPTKRVKIFNKTVLEVFSYMLTAKEPIAFIVPYEYYGYFGVKNSSLWQNLHLVRERLLTQQLTIYVRHNSYLIPSLNTKLSLAHFSGFSANWARENVVPMERAVTHTNRDEKNTNRNSNKNPLLMEDLGAIFMILVWLDVFAAVVFVIELLWHRYGNLIKKLVYSQAIVLN